MEPLRLRRAGLNALLPGLATPGARGIARAWLAAAVAALGASGLLALLVVAARAPEVGRNAALAAAFPRALVVHVTYGVIAWLAAGAALVWTLLGSGRAAGAGAGVFWAGLVLVGVAGVAGEGRALLADYVPVLDSGAFLFGLGLLATGAALAAAGTLGRVPRGAAAPATAAALAFLAALVTVACTGAVLPPPEGEEGYARLFWAAGHQMQLAWTLLMVAVWGLLARAGGIVPPREATAAATAAGLLVLAAAVLATAVEPPSRPGPVHTRLMALGGLAPLPLVVALAVPLLRAAGGGTQATTARTALRASLLLYLAGGALAFTIAGADTRVPAHYHASIAGVTLALMGLAYLLLPALGCRPVRPALARAQLALYAAGQLAHALGLAWAGGAGAARKTALAAGGGADSPAALALAGGGGLLAAAGGALFVLSVGYAALRASPTAGEAADEGEHRERQHENDGEEDELAVRQARAAAPLDPQQGLVGGQVEADADGREEQDLEQLAFHRRDAASASEADRGAACAR